MQKQSGIRQIVKLITLCLLATQVGCAHKAKVETPIQPPPPLKGPLVLELKAAPGRKEIAAQCSEATTSFSEKGALRRKRIESVDFKSLTKNKGIVEENGLKGISQELKVIEKKGNVNLRDLAYPEEGETLDFILTPQGQVLKAGDYPKNSLYYVPSIPLPEHPVDIGNRWDKVSKWRSLNNDIELTATLHSELMGFKPCGNHNCAVVKVFGQIEMPKAITKTNKFSHLVEGQYLFEPESGILVWAEFTSREKLIQGSETLDVVSSLRSSLLEPAGYFMPSPEFQACPFEK